MTREELERKVADGIDEANGSPDDVIDACIRVVLEAAAKMCRDEERAQLRKGKPSGPEAALLIAQRIRRAIAAGKDEVL